MDGWKRRLAVKHTRHTEDFSGVFSSFCSSTDHYMLSFYGKWTSFVFYEKQKVKFWTTWGRVNDVLGELQTFFSLCRYQSAQINPYSERSYASLPSAGYRKTPLWVPPWWKLLHRLLCAPSGRAVAVGRQAREDLEADQAWLQMKRGLGFQQEAIAEMRGGGLKRQDESGKNGAEERGGLNKRERIPGSNSNTLCGRKTEPLNSSFRKWTGHDIISSLAGAGCGPMVVQFLQRERERKKEI